MGSQPSAWSATAAKSFGRRAADQGAGAVQGVAGAELARGLDRLGVGGAGLDGGELADVRGGFRGPQGAHQGHPVPDQFAAGAPLDAVVGGFLDVPAVADPEGEAAAGEVVQGGDPLREVDRVVLGDQGDAGAEGDALGHGGGLGQGDEGVEGAPVHLGELAAHGRGGVAADRDVGVLGEVEPGEPALLEGAGEADGGDGVVGQEDGRGDPHG